MKSSSSFTDHVIGYSDGDHKSLAAFIAITNTARMPESGVRSQSVLIPDRRCVMPTRVSDQVAWATISAFISSSPSLRVILLSQDVIHDAKLAKIVKPADHARLCLGATASNREEVCFRLEELKNVRGPFRLLILRGLSDLPDIGFSPDCVDWIVCDPASGPTFWIDGIEQACQDSGIAFLRLDGMQIEDSPHPWHPFGPGANLRMPRAACDASEVCEISVEVVESGAGEVLSSLGDGEIESGEMLAEFHRLDHIVMNGVVAAFEAGRALLEISERELWRVAGYSTWAAYCIDARGLTKQRVNQKIKAAKVMKAITPLLQSMGKDNWLPANEGQVRELHCLKDPRKQAEACVIAASEANGKPSSRHLADAASKLLGKETTKAKSKSTRYEKNVTDALSRLGKAIRSDQERTHVLNLIESLKEEILRHATGPTN